MSDSAQYSCADHHECSPDKLNCEQYRAPCVTTGNGSIIYRPETVTTVSIENREGEVRKFVLRDKCDRLHYSYGLYDSDYDYTTLAFEHGDSTSEPCLGTWFAPGF